VPPRALWLARPIPHYFGEMASYVIHFSNLPQCLPSCGKPILSRRAEHFEGVEIENNFWGSSAGTNALLSTR
jgi:hypothetical protein